MYQYQTYVEGRPIQYFSYAYPTPIPLGTWVRVSFGNKKMRALIIAQESYSPNKFKKLKKIESIDPLYPLSESMLSLLLFACDYYLASIEDYLKTFYPHDVISVSKRIKLIHHFIPMNEQEQAILTYFEKKNSCTLSTLKKYASPSTIQQLINKNYLSEEHLERVRQGTTPQSETTLSFKNPYELNSEQQRVFNAISTSHKRYHLLHGVTGSGKTAVYINLIHQTLLAGKSALFLLPEISLTAQLIEAFEKSFPNQIAILHSKLTASQYSENWLQVYHGDKKIVLGVRSAVFAPLTNLGLIIIDEEHETTYKQDTTPFYHTRLIAQKRVQLEGAILLLGSATPSVESFYYSQQEVIELHQLTQRFHTTTPVKFSLVNLTQERSIFSKLLLYKMNETLLKNEQIILFLNKKGFAKFIQCPSCGHVERCPHCSISLTYSKLHEKLNCHYCGFEKPFTHRCSQCGEKSLNLYDYGIEKIGEEIQKRFPNAKIALADSQLFKDFSTYQAIYQSFLNHDIDILIGTQIISKGFHFPDLTLVGVLNADNILNFPDFRASEKTFQLLLQVAGRSGRESKPGEVVIQTASPSHYAIELSTHEKNYRHFYEKEIEIRELLNYPPFGKIILIHLIGNDQQKLEHESHQIFKELLSNSWQVYGPMPSPISKMNDSYRYQIFIKTSVQIPMDLKERLLKLKRLSSLERFLIDVDPINFL